MDTVETRGKLKPIHLGKILLEEFMTPMNITQYRLAKGLGVQPTWVNQIINGHRSITAEAALRLGRFFNMEADFWINLQVHYEMELERDRLEASGILETEVEVFQIA